MAKVLVAVRLPPEAVQLLKDLASEREESQAQVVVEGLELVQLKTLYKQEPLVVEKQANKGVAIRK